MPEEEEEVERDESGTIFESRVQRLVQKADNLRFKPSPDVGDTIIKLSEFFQNIYLQWHDLVGIWITQSHKATFPATCDLELADIPEHKKRICIIRTCIVLESGRARVTQTTYANKVVKRYGFEGANTSKTPLQTDWTAICTEAPSGGMPKMAAEVDVREALGSIGYLATKTRPGLLFAHGVLSTVASPSATLPDAPCPGHRAALCRVLRYLKGTTELGLSYERDPRGLRLTAWMDASHGREVHHWHTASSQFSKGRVNLYSACWATWWFPMTPRRPSATLNSVFCSILVKKSATLSGPGQKKGRILLAS